MRNQNRLSEWAALAVLAFALRQLSDDGHGPLEYGVKLAVDVHGEVPGGSVVGARS